MGKLSIGTRNLTLRKVALETCGGLGPEAAGLMEKLGPLWATRKGLPPEHGEAQLCDRLSVAHQRALGTALATRVPLGHGVEVVVGADGVALPRGRRPGGARGYGVEDAWGRRGVVEGGRAHPAPRVIDWAA